MAGKSISHPIPYLSNLYEKLTAVSKKNEKFHACVNKPGISINIFNVSGLITGLFQKKSKPKKIHLVQRHHLPKKRIIKRPFASHPSIENFEKWAESLKLFGNLKFHIPTKTNRITVLQLFYEYKHFNGTDFTKLPCTDFIVYRIRFSANTKPRSIFKQKRRFIYIEWWLRKLVQNGIDGNIYEFTTVNGRLFQ